MERKAWIKLLRAGYRRVTLLRPDEIKPGRSIERTFKTKTKIILVKVVGVRDLIQYYMFPMYRNKNGDLICRRWDAWDEIFLVHEDRGQYIAVSVYYLDHPFPHPPPAPEGGSATPKVNGDASPEECAES